MALSYTNLFNILGEHVERVNEFRAIYTTIDTAESETEADYATASRYDLLAALPSMFKNFKTQVLSWISTVNAQATTALTDRDLVLKELPLGGATDVNTVLKYLFAQMILDSKTINRSSVTIGSVTRTVTNATAGTAVTSKVLDGYTAPMTGAMAISGYNGVDSELSFADTVTLRCVSDSETGTSEGAEVFQWNGLPKPSFGQFGWESTGSGTGPSVTCLHSYSYFRNQDFEDFTTNAPDNWTIASGSAGTHIFENTSTPYHDDAGLKYTGDGAQATISITQTPTSSNSLIPLKRYCLSCRVKGEAATLAGTLTIQFEGTGYTAASSEKIELDATALSAQTSYDLEYFFINMPLEIPDDFKLVIKVTGTLTNAKSVYVDHLAFGPVTYENGVNVAIIAGATKFLKGDTLVFTISNNDAGVFQTWFRKMFLVQMPSSGAPNIADSLAT